MTVWTLCNPLPLVYSEGVSASWSSRRIFKQDSPDAVPRTYVLDAPFRQHIRMHTFRLNKPEPFPRVLAENHVPVYDILSKNRQV